MSWIDKLKDIHDRVTAARAGKLDYLQNLENGVYFDSVLGSAGTDWPKGTAQDASNTPADVITMCAARKNKNLHIRGTFTLGAAMEDYNWRGRSISNNIFGSDYIVLGGFSVDGGHFYNLSVSGVATTNNEIFATRCKLALSTNAIRLIAESCRFSTVETLNLYNTSHTLKNCFNPASGYVTISAPGAVAVLEIPGWIGKLTIQDLEAGAVVNIDGVGDLRINGTGGTVTVRGDIAVTDLSAGAVTINDYTSYAQRAAIKAVADAAAADAATAAAAAVSAAVDAAIAAGHANPDPAGTAAALIGALNNLAAGAQMDLVNAPNATAVTAIQLGLAKTAELISGAAIDFGAVAKASIQAAAQAAITASSLALASNCDAKSSDIKAKTDKITLPVYRQVFKSADSAMLASLAFGSVAADKDFPSVVATAKPTGATVTKAYWGFSYSKKVDSSAGANAVSAAGKAVRVKVSTGAWGTDDIVAYTFANGALSTPASATEGGMMIMGSVDIKSVVDGSAATFNFRSEETNRGDALTVTGASLTFYDVESWLIVEYTL